MQDSHLFGKSVITKPLWERLLADQKKGKSSKNSEAKGKKKTVIPI